MPELAMVNGEISALEDARISVNDRGLLFADAVYEVVAAYSGKLFLFDGHMRRLKRSLREMHILDAVDLRKIRRQIREVFGASGIADAKIYLQISRGSAPRAHPYPDKAEPNVFITVRPLGRHKESEFRKGWKVITYADERWARCDIKTVCLLGNVRAKQAAIQAGAADALMLASDGVVREATAANAFFVQDGVVYTHPKSDCILGGITRDHLIKLAKTDGIRLKQEKHKLESFLCADEVFLSGTTAEVMPVIRIDDRRIANGGPGPVAKRLRELFVQSIRSLT